MNGLIILKIISWKLNELQEITGRPFNKIKNTIHNMNEKIQ